MISSHRLFLPLGAALAAVMSLGLAARAAPAAGLQAASDHGLALVQTIALPGVKGGFDLMAADLPGRRLFLDAEDNNTTEVLSLAGRGSRITSLAGMHAPKWAVVRPELNRLYIANGDGELKILDARSFALVKALRLAPPANNLRFDPAAHALLVGVGQVQGAIAVVDARTDQVTRTIALASFPKQFELDGDKLYVNIPAKRLIQVLDWKTGAVLANWPLGACENVPMDLDRAAHRLFVACTGGELVTVATADGHILARTPISRDADGVHYDPRADRIYVSAGEGFIDILGRARQAGYARIGRVATREGAGTSILVPQLLRLLVALPQHDGQPAELRAYQLRP